MLKRILPLVLAMASTDANADVVGRASAEERCAGCHAIGETGASANKNAPTFRSLHTRYPFDALRPAFLKGMEVGHRDMPRFVMSSREIDDILSYLRSLDPCGKPSTDKIAMARCFEPLKR